jgi:hypothetical protein
MHHGFCKMFSSTPSLILTSALFLLSSAVAENPPTAQTLNGTYAGVHSTQFDQDFFLGIHYLQAPVGDRRFTPPTA